MLLDPLLPRQCVQCPDPQPCNCGPNQTCFQINRDCNTCSQTKCVDRAPSSGSSQGISKGALVGGIIGALLFLAIAATLFLLYRRRSRAAKGSSTILSEIKEVPASAETVLNRPDPADKQAPPTQVNNVRVYPMTSTTTINLDPESQRVSPGTTNNLPPPAHPPSDPFEDTHSIQTAGTEGTNVIPIALVQPESLRTQASGSSTSSSSSQPMRPPRSPDLNLNLDHLNVSNSSVRTRPYTRSTRSGVSRNSFMSSASYSSDFLNEAPVIVTSSKTAVRQVLGVVKPQVITAGSAEGLKPPAKRLANKSPLASSSFGPQDLVRETDESQEANDPFDDEHSTRAEYGASASPGTPNSTPAATHTERQSSSSNWTLEQPKLPWKGHQPSSSVSTQAGSVIDIGNATRVKLSPGNLPDPRSPYRTTMAKLVDPATLQEQQRKAFTQQAQAQNMDKSRRVSGSSAISAASRAYSILESFPFVPPSPISDRPIRSPPRSPQNQQNFANSASSPLSQTFQVTPPSPLPRDTPENDASGGDGELPAPPDRRTLGLSGVSTASSGLGSFPFQIDTSSGHDISTSPSVPSNGRQRASLDTLALTSDLSSYPLAFDRDSLPLPPPKRI